MDAVSSVSPIGFRIIWNVRYETFDLPDSNDASQKDNELLGQMNVSKSKIIQQFQESKDVHLEFEIDNERDCVSVRVINKSSGKVIREIQVRPEVKMDMLKGVICQTFV